MSPYTTPSAVSERAARRFRSFESGPFVGGAPTGGDADVFVPDLRARPDELLHELHAARGVELDDGDAGRPEALGDAREGAAPPDDHDRDAEEEHELGAVGAGRERRVEHGRGEVAPAGVPRRVGL